MASSVPSAGPKKLVYTATAKTITVTWNEIDCIHRNGPIIGYEGKLEDVATSTTYNGTVMNQTFTAGNLSPYTFYIFHVAGKTVNGTGAFSIAVVMTEDGGKFNSRVLHIDKYRAT